MHDQRLAAGPGCADVHAKAVALPAAVFGRVAFGAVVVQPGLADGDDSRVVGKCEQAGDIGFAAAGVVRVYAHRRIQVRVLLGQRAHAREVLEGDRHTQRAIDAVIPHPGEHTLEALGEFREIEVTVGVDVHAGRPVAKCAAAHSTGASTVLRPPRSRVRRCASAWTTSAHHRSVPRSSLAPARPRRYARRRCPALAGVRCCRSA